MCASNSETKNYLAIATDPLHIGAGSARLARVDLPIAREPGTNLPKVPGSSVSGPARAYTALATCRYRWKEGKDEYLCAGSGGPGGDKHCGRPDPACPVCIPYGFSKGTGSMQGLAQFFDAHILFFPVASMSGPLWVTSPSALSGPGLDREIPDPEECFLPLGAQLKNGGQRLNLGWLMLSKSNKEDNNVGKQIDTITGLPETIKTKSVLVSDKLFSQIVNNNLEVRTSVSIDPATGAAEDKALFTYEALPRGTVLRFDVQYNSGYTYRINKKQLKTEDGGEVGSSWVKVQVEKGLKLFASLGIGGMNTRGMGRLKVLNLGEEAAGNE